MCIYYTDPIQYHPTGLHFCSQLMKINATKVRFSIILVTTLLCLGWAAGVWIVESDQIQQKAKILFDKEDDNTKNRGEAISADLQRSLSVLYGLPEVIGSWDEVKNVVKSYPQSDEPEAKRLANILSAKNASRTEHLNQLLLLAKKDFSVDIIWLLDLNGDCVADSNYNTSASLMGNNFKERNYFNIAKAGGFGYQFAIGKVSKTKGLYFSAPVLVDSRVVGVVVVKVDITRLAKNINFSNSFLVDENGVIILSDNPEFDLKVVPQNTIKTMSFDLRKSIYARDELETLYIQPWSDGKYPRLSKIADFGEPFVLNITNVNEGELQIYVFSSAREILLLDQELLRLFLLLTFCGVAVIIIAGGIVLTLHAKHLTNQFMQLQHDELNEAQKLAKLGSWSYDYMSEQLHCSRVFLTDFLLRDDAGGNLTPTLHALLENVHPDDKERVRAEFEGGLKSGTGYTVEYRLIRKNGEIRNVIGNAVVRKDSKGHRLKVTGTCKDVTEEQRNLRAIEDSENHLRNVLNSSLIGIIQGNDTGRILEMNQAFMTLTGYSAENLVEGKLKWKDIASDSFQSLNSSHIFGKVKSPSPFEMTLTCSNGSAIPVLIGMARVEDARSEWVCFVLDLSERNRINQLKSEFISIVSHELRTPLTSIRGSLALLEAGVVGAAEEKGQELIKIAHKNSQRLVVIINDILDLEKLSAGNMVLEMQSVEFSTVIRQVIEINNELMRQYNVTVRIGDLPDSATIWGDTNRVMQVLTNLISNAAKFSPEGGVVDVHLLREGQYWRVEIHDSGPGITDEFRERIFGAFSQSELTNVRQKGGIGLGLNIAKIIVEKMEGLIGYESAEGKGSVFWVAFVAL